MVRQNPYKESCIERMKELVRENYSKIAVIKQIKKEFKYVHQSTFYPWYDIAIDQEDIKIWEEDNQIEIHDKRQDKIDLKYQIYKDQKAIYTNKESSMDEKEKAMNILLSHFLKRVE